MMKNVYKIYTIQLCCFFNTKKPLKPPLKNGNRNYKKC